MRDVGFNTVKPEITRISFRKAEFITLHLEDGRALDAPLSRFPGIAQLSPIQRRHYHIADGDILLFRDDDEVYHIQDFLGTYETNAYHSPGKQQARTLVNA
ncbi:DUF2442 domain-containing protein [Spirosoma arcticum]